MNLADVLDLEAVPQLADAAVQQRFFVALGASLRHEETVL
jgi:MSHA biogenesis protein MshI